MQVVRDSHVVEIKNVVSKFKGVLKETIQKKLDEQKLKYELENKEMRDNYMSMKIQIRKLEEKCEQLQEKINERDKRLQETYDKIMKMNNESSFKNVDQDKLQKIIKEKDQQIEKLQKCEKALESLQQQKVDYALLFKEKDNQINQRDDQIKKLQKQLEKQNARIFEQDQKIRTLEQESNKITTKNTLVSDEEALDAQNKQDKVVIEQNYSVFRQTTPAPVSVRTEPKNDYFQSIPKQRVKKQQVQAIPIQNFGEIPMKNNKPKKGENMQNRQHVEKLTQKIKFKEDQKYSLNSDIYTFFLIPFYIYQYIHQFN